MSHCLCCLVPSEDRAKALWRPSAAEEIMGKVGAISPPDGWRPQAACDEEVD